MAVRQARDVARPTEARTAVVVPVVTYLADVVDGPPGSDLLSASTSTRPARVRRVLAPRRG